MQELNIMTWYTNREVSYCPIHFVKAGTKLTDESMNWIYEKLYGRFYTTSGYPYFEDPQEAVYYELVWS